MAVTHHIEVTGVSLSPTTAPAGSQVSVTVSINRPAPAGGVSVSIAANPAANATVPKNVVIQKGSTRATFKATLNYVGVPTTTVIYANYNTTKHAQIGVTVFLQQSVPPNLVIPAPVLVGTVISVPPPTPTPPPPPPLPIVVVPPAPTNLAIFTSPTQNTLSWTASNGATSYKLKRATVNGGPYVTIAILPVPGYIDTGLSNGTTYYYVTTASNSAGESGNSSQVSGTPQANAPVATSGLTAIAGDSQVALTWNSSVEAITYNIKRSLVSGGPYSTIGNTSSTNYTDLTVSDGTVYYYVVTVVNTNGESPASNQATAIPQVAPPGIPTGLAAVAGDTTVSLTWISVIGATSYNVKRATTSGGPYTTVGSPTVTNFANAGLTDGVTYYFVVSAVNLGGQSANSTQVSAIPVAVLPTPTFTDSFSTGALDTTKWIPSNWSAPGNISGVNVGTFSSSQFDFSQGMLRIALTQTRQSDGSIVSVGGELQSKNAFGYGTYEWIYRIASTSATANGSGSIVSGSDCGGFTFINNSQTEIDFESEGQFASQLELTNWSTTANQQYSPVTLANLSAFHSFKFVWAPGRIDFYVDNVLVSTHTQNVPTTPAYQMLNFWGTNSSSFGGVATAGVTRYFYVSKVSFWAA